METVQCECGCGGAITLKRHHRYRHPRFISGHNARSRQNGRPGRPRLEPPDEIRPTLTGTCGCGCGEPTPTCTNSRPAFHEYFGYPMRYLHGHHPNAPTASRSGRWKGGRIVSTDGYVLVYDPKHPMAGPTGYVLEHRLVMSNALERSLDRHEHVHHKNGNRQDNRPENLELLVVGLHPTGQRAEDLVRYARDVLAKYGHLFPA